MKTGYVFCILFLLVSSQALAQLRCKSCDVYPSSRDRGNAPSKWWGWGDPDGKRWHYPYESDWVVIMYDPGIFYGTIVLKDNGTDHTSLFEIEEEGPYATRYEGHYAIQGVISTDPSATRPVGITVSAPYAGTADWGGHKAGITFIGDKPNTYTGPTIIKSGYLACNKTPGTVAIPGDMILSQEGSSPLNLIGVSLRFTKDHQLSGRGKIIFDRAKLPTARFELNGTTQTIAGIELSADRVNNEYGLVYNMDTNDPINPEHYVSPNEGPRPKGEPRIDYFFSRNTLTTAVLILNGGSKTYTYGGTNNRLTSIWAARDRKGGLEVQVKGTGQRFLAPEKISYMTFNTESGSIVDFVADSETPGELRTLGDNILFKGTGTVKKTGRGILDLANSTLALSGGRIWVAAHTLRNSSHTVYSTEAGQHNIFVTEAGQINKAVLHLEGLWNPTFDLNGVHSFFGGLSGNGMVENNDKGHRILTLETETDNIFTGQIKDNSSGQAVSETETGKGGIILVKKGSGTQVLKGINFYTGKTVVAAGTLKLQGGAKLGTRQQGDAIVQSPLEISNSANPAAVFEHNGSETLRFEGDIISYTDTNPASNPQRGIYRQSGSGATLIKGTKTFTGEVEVTGGILSGFADLSKAHSMTVGAQGAIGGGTDYSGGGDLSVPNLTFTDASSTLLVYPRSAASGHSVDDPLPSTVVVKAADGSPGTVTAPHGFQVKIAETRIRIERVWSGYLIKCNNGLRDNLPLPALARASNSEPEYEYCLSWRNDGLWLSVGPTGIAFDKPADITVYSGRTQPEIVFTPTSGEGVPTGYQWWQYGDQEFGRFTDEVGLADHTADWTRKSIPAFTAPVTTVALKRGIEVIGRAVGNNRGCYTARRFVVTVELTPTLTCDNCTFTGPDGPITGTRATPATILSGPDGAGEFTGDITLNGACNFTVHNKGHFILSGQITGTGPLTYRANEAGVNGNLAGVTLSGTRSNTYTGLTTVTKGYLICNKTNATAIPNDVKISAVSGNLPAHLWCKANNQFGTSVVDFSDEQGYSYFYLNGTTQSIAGLKSNGSSGAVLNWQARSRALSLPAAPPTGEGILNIAVPAGNTCLFGAGNLISRGINAPELTVNVTGGTQILENPRGVSDVTLTSQVGATLEFRVPNLNTIRISGVTLKGNGLIKKTGAGTLTMPNARVLKSGGQIWVAEGTLRNEGTDIYSTGTETNLAILRLQVAEGSTVSAPIFDLHGSNVIFAGLTGNGIVQNDFASAGILSPEGYNELFLKLTESSTFTGVIRNNAANTPPESGGGDGKGGVALKIEGNNLTLTLSGVNLYTGSTVISSGRLLLTGDAQLGGGTYPGALEISNSSTSQATFEHSGSSIQFFTGDITSAGAGNVKGLFLQSGRGKSILNGTKTFAGNVTVANGFLGGSGSLANVNSVSVEENGSIGGGEGAGGSGGLLTVKGVTFTGAETAKLIVTAKSDNNPSLLEVQSLPVFTNVNKLTVDILSGENLHSGYIIRYPDNGSRPSNLPTPEHGLNTTGKKVGLNWNNVGLFMQAAGEAGVTLSVNPASLCPKGTNPGNSKIVVEVTYSNVNDLPAADAVINNFFTLSDNSVKSGNIAVRRSGSVITAEFDGANTTNATLPYTITYNDLKNAAIRIDTRINRMPVLSISAGANPACTGTPIVLRGVSKDGAGTVSSRNRGVAATGRTTADLTATATTLTAGEVDFLLTDTDGCKSEYVHVTVSETPVVTPESPTMCSAVNNVGNTTLISADQPPTATSALTWAINPPVEGASIEDVTVGDRQARFTVTNTAAVTVQKQFTVEYTGQGGCKGRAAVTVNPSPTVSPALSTICAAVNNAANIVALRATQDPGSGAAWTMNPAADADALIEDITPTDRLALFRVRNADMTVQKQYVIEYLGQEGCKAMSVIRVDPVPAITANSGFDLAKLCAGASYPEAVTVSRVTAGNWAVFRAGSITAESTISTQVIASATANRGTVRAGNTTAATAVRDDAVFISEAGCKSNILPIVVHPIPVMNEIADQAYCQNIGIQAFIPPSSGAGEAKPTHYQWRLAPGAANRDDINLADHTADWTKTAVSSFTPPNSTVSLRRDLTIKGYNSVSGCVSESQVYTVTLQKALNLTYKSISPICSGTDTYIFLQSSDADTNYTWTVPADNGVGARSQVTASPPVIKQRLNNSGSVTYTVTAVSGICTSTVQIPVEVNRSTVAKPAVSGGGNYCVNPEGDGNIYQTNLIPSAAGASAEWLYASGLRKSPAEAVSGNTQKLEKGVVTAVRDNLILSGRTPATVYYIFRPFAGCLGTPSDSVFVKIYPAPVTPPVANSVVCSHSTAHPTATNIALDNSVAGVKYTWTVDRTNSADVSGYTEPSREGAVVPTANPPASTGGPVVNSLVLAAAAASAQTIIYHITPWHSGCPGKAAAANVVVNPLPVVNKPADRQYCSGMNVEAVELTGSHEANAFKWSGGLAVGLANQVEYGPGLPAYKAPSPVETVSAEVKISAKNNNGCESASEVTFTLSVVPKPSLTLSISSPTLCTGPTIEKAAAIRIKVETGSAHTKYKWIARATGAAAEGVKLIKGTEDLSFPVTENDPQEGDIVRKTIAAAGSAADLTFSVQPVAEGCSGEIKTVSLTVTGNDLTAGIINNSESLCSTKPVDIKVGNEGDGNTYSWTVTDNTNNVGGYSQQPEGRSAATIRSSLTLRDNKRGNVTYTFTPSRAGCEGAAISHTVFVNPVPIIKVLPEAATAICSGAKTDINLSVNLSAPESEQVAYLWEVSANSLGAHPNTVNPGVFVQQTLTNQGTTDAGVTYTFTPHYIPADGKGRCQGLPGSVVYTVRPHIGAILSNNSEPWKACLGDEVILRAAAPENAAYQWLKDETDIPNATGDSYTVPTISESAFTYTVRATTKLGCTVSDSRRVEVTKDVYFTDGKAEIFIDEKAVTAGPKDVDANKRVDFKYTAPNTKDIEYSWDFKDNSAVAITQNASHTYSSSGSFLPTLTVVKVKQSTCTKIFALPELKVAPEAVAGDSDTAPELSVFPVPAQSQLTIVSEGSDLQHITIRDISGKKVLSEAVNGRKAALRIAHLASGIYLLTVTDSKGVKQLKIIKN